MTVLSAPFRSRWIPFSALAACGAALALFRGRHFEPRSLVLELPLAAAAVLTWYGFGVIRPEAEDIRKKMEHPEFQGTAHLEKLQLSFQQRRRLLGRLHGLTLFLGWFALLLAVRFLR